MEVCEIGKQATEQKRGQSQSSFLPLLAIAFYDKIQTDNTERVRVAGVYVIRKLISKAIWSAFSIYWNCCEHAEETTQLYNHEVCLERISPHVAGGCLSDLYGC